VHCYKVYPVSVQGYSSSHKILRRLCFADNIKLYARISSNDDCLKLQDNFNRFSEWFGKLELSLNLSKCKIMTLTTICSSIIFSYFFDESDIIRVSNSIVDLGF